MASAWAVIDEALKAAFAHKRSTVDGLLSRNPCLVTTHEGPTRADRSARLSQISLLVYPAWTRLV
jgi:hypothetical protein